VLQDRIRLLLAGDHILDLGVLRTRFDREPDLEVVAELDSDDDVPAAAKHHRAHVAVLDCCFPAQAGIAVTAELRTAMPECKVLMLTTVDRPGYLRRGLNAGARGVVLQNAPDLADAVRRVHLGLRVIDTDLAVETLRYEATPLDDGETDTLRAARDGGSVADLAEKLEVSEGLVRRRLWSAIGKTGARTRADAIVIAERKGWLLD